MDKPIRLPPRPSADLTNQSVSGLIGLGRRCGERALNTALKGPREQTAARILLPLSMRPRGPCFMLGDILCQHGSLFDYQIPFGMEGPLLVLWAPSRSFCAVVLYF